MNINGKASVDFGGNRILPLKLMDKKQHKDGFEDVAFQWQKQQRRILLGHQRY